ncbi:MAG: glycosyltransferase [Candidatus Aminicenantes bacterium]|nr:glycosyltransferase [Candidatus Aminicenantes bacterium]
MITTKKRLWSEGNKHWEGHGVRPRSRRSAVRFPFLRKRVDPVAIALALLGGGGVVILAVKFRLFEFWIELLGSTALLRLITYPLAVSALILLVGIVLRTVLWLHYHPEVLAPGEKVDWPPISVIIAALNEEEMVGKAIDSVFSSIYPPEKIQVVCVNDGSTDGTQAEMRKAKEKYGDRLTIVRFRKNRGKRKAFYAGLKKSQGEIIVSVDADGKIGRSALRNIIIPLLRDPRVGAVAGSVTVLNEKENFLTRMISTRYALAFDFGRGYQSVYGGVFCCPGALTAYRRDLVELNIRDWLNQKFLNVACSHGEDRALTTLILKSGYLVKYQSNALVYTKVPASFVELNKMYLRWTRSYLRESALFAKFMFLPYRDKHRLLPIFDFFFENLLHPFQLLALVVVGYAFFVSPVFILPTLAFLTVVSFLFSLIHLRTRRGMSFLYGIPYAFVAAFLQWWIVPVSALTIRNQSWLTR